MKLGINKSEKFQLGMNKSKIPTGTKVWQVWGVCLQDIKVGMDDVKVDFFTNFAVKWWMIRWEGEFYME